ncbi:MAG: CbiX/SirB N-terminal domain-containing protein [Polyangiaceae bacterium]|nr:CbiX/SirB N-terminal domain-containing protein [Polyangiaceae bacterium]
MSTRAVIFVGHGGVPSDFPRADLTRLKMLEGKRHASGGPPSDEERALDTKIRTHPRTPQTDPYQAGFERVAAALAAKLPQATLFVAYNEFCAPTLEQAAEQAIGGGALHITVIPSMLTPGGVHSEVEVPEAIAALKPRFPNVTFEYIWPFDLDLVANMLAAQIMRTQTA